MALKVEHELHARRKGRNIGVLLLLLLFIVMIFALTVVKVMQLGDLGVGNRMDRPSTSVPDPDYIAPEGGQ